MSVIAVKVDDDNIYISSDSIEVSGTTQQKLKDCKLKSINSKFFVAGSGLASSGNLFFEYCKMKKKITDNSEMGILTFMIEFKRWCKKSGFSDDVLSNASYLIVYNSKVYYCNGIYIREIKDFHAIGAGSDYALAAMHSGMTTERAVEIACELSIYCEKPITTHVCNK